MEIPFNQEANFLDMLGFITPLPAPMQQRIGEQILTESFSRKHLLLCPGQTAKRIYFICKGYLRGYFIDREGNECTTWFMGKGDVMISVSSFLTQKPSHEYIEVIQDCTLQSISWHELNGHYADFREGNLVGRIIAEKYFILSEERAMFFKTQNPEARYDLLLEKDPDIEQKTTQGHIASYLGISRETLSRIRRKKLKMCQMTQKRQSD